RLLASRGLLDPASLPPLLGALAVVRPPHLLAVTSAHLALLLVRFVPDGKLCAALARRVDRVQERGRTPACSRCRIAMIVVPPGDVTISRSSTGCFFVSLSIFAEPSIVWMISSVATSRESPSSMQASIIASASRKK